jgi:hypothetical protein
MESPKDQSRWKKLERENPIVVKTIASKIIPMNSRISEVICLPYSERWGVAYTLRVNPALNTAMIPENSNLSAIK